MVYISFGNQILRQNGALAVPDVKFENATDPFFVDLELPLGDKNYYTLVIYDNDAPYPNNNYLSPYVHLFAYNILDGDVYNADLVLSYEPPNPPRDSPIHKYHVEVYRQKGKIGYPKLNLTRHNFPLKNMLNLATRTDRLTFTVGDPPTVPSFGNGSPIVIPSVPSFGNSSSIRIPSVPSFGNSSPIRIPSVPVVSTMNPVTTLESDIVPTGRGQHDFFISDSNLDETQKKFCSCIIKVEAKGGVRSPYAICAHSVGTTTRDCSKNYNFRRMPDYLIQAYASLHHIDLPEPYNRQQALGLIHNKFKK